METRLAHEEATSNVRSETRLRARRKHEELIDFHGNLIEMKKQMYSPNLRVVYNINEHVRETERERLQTCPERVVEARVRVMASGISEDICSRGVFKMRFEDSTDGPSKYNILLNKDVTALVQRK